PGADVVPAAAAARDFLRHRGPGGDYSSRPDRWQHGPSLSQTPAGARSSDLCASLHGPDSFAHAWSAVVSRATAQYGEGLRGLYRRRGRRVAARVWFQTL